MRLRRRVQCGGVEMSGCVYCNCDSTDGVVCAKSVPHPNGFSLLCTREAGHTGPCVACASPEHNLTNVAEPEEPLNPSSPLATQVGGHHYKSMKIQPDEFCHANGIGPIEGLIIKYTVRHRSKGKAEDLRKAKHCIDLLLKLEYGEA